MRLSFRILAVALFALVACAKRQTSVEDQLSRFKEGDPASSLEAALSLSSHPSFYTPNLPLGEEHIIYFLPEGDLHVMSKLIGDGRSVLSPAPFFLPDRMPVAERVDRANRSWDDYVRSRTGR